MRGHRCEHLPISPAVKKKKKWVRVNKCYSTHDRAHFSPTVGDDADTLVYVNLSTMF